MNSKTIVDETMDRISLPAGHGLQFSAVKPEHLTETEYTLVTILCDITGSVSDFKDELLKCIKACALSCKGNKRSAYLLLRYVNFNEGIHEVHGFKMLSTIEPDNYEELEPYGGTALFDASDEAITSTLIYAKNLAADDYDVNGAVYIITDGDDNSSRFSNPSKIKKLIEKAKKDEKVIKSLLTVLIGVNAQQYSQELKDFKDQAGLTQFVEVKDALPKTLAKLANFVSNSVSSHSVSLKNKTVSIPIEPEF